MRFVFINEQGQVTKEVWDNMEKGARMKVITSLVEVDGRKTLVLVDNMDKLTMDRVTEECGTHMLNFDNAGYRVNKVVIAVGNQFVVLNG